MDLQSCIEAGTIKKDEYVKEFILPSIEHANTFLNSCESNIKINEYQMVFIAGYMSIFHSARALLYNKVQRT